MTVNYSNPLHNKSSGIALGDDLPDNDASCGCRGSDRERLECRADQAPLPDERTPNP